MTLLLTLYTQILFQATWDTTRIYTGNGTLQKISVGNKIKGILDDTFRIATGQGGGVGTYNALLLTDTSSSPPIRHRTEILFSGAVGNGIISVTIGDADGDGKNEILFGQAAGSLKLVKWTGTGFNVTRIDSQPGTVYDIAIGDANNDGLPEIIFSRYNCVFRTFWNGSSWRTSQIWTGDGNRCRGVAIGDFDNAFSGNEIVAVSYYRAVRLRWNGTLWEPYTMYSNTDCYFYVARVGDFDAANPGKEIAIGNGLRTHQYGAVIELFGSGTNWDTTAIYSAYNQEYQDLSIGDILDEHTGDEVVGIKSNAPVDIRVIYGSGTDWNNQLIYTKAGVGYGITVGDINRYRTQNLEIAFSRANMLYEAEQWFPPAPVITNLSRLPKVPRYIETVIVQAKIYDLNYPLPLIDSLYYAINDSSFWFVVARDSFRSSDSLHFYSIPAQDTGTKIFYRIMAKNPGGSRALSPINSYIVALEHSIRSIQWTSLPNGRSPDSGRWVNTQGIVSGVFGRFFFIEENPGGAWHGIYIRRLREKDSLPKLQVGDSVMVLGLVDEYLNQTVLHLEYDSGARINLLTQGRPLPDTTIVPIPQIAESLEGSLVRIDTVHFKASGNFIPGTYWIYNAQETESLPVFIRSETNIPGSPIPSSYLIITGNLNQFLLEYQILPRGLSDLRRLPVDVGVTEILAPKDTLIAGETIIPSAIIQNFGAHPVYTLLIYFQIGGIYTSSQTIPVLLPQEIDTVRFTPWISILGNYLVRSWTQTPDDSNPQNDTAFGDITVISPQVAGWFQLRDIPQGLSNKRVKGGGSLVATSDTIYALKGNNTLEFYAYLIMSDSWLIKRSLPYTKKRVKRGSALTYNYKENAIYALKGSNTLEFFKYEISKDSWVRLRDLPLGNNKRVKGGSGLAFIEKDTTSFCYFLKGSKSQEFYAYHITGDSFITLSNLPSPLGYGSCLTYDDSNFIYVLKAKTNEFYAYDISLDTWLTKPSLPLVSSSGKKKRVKDGAALTFDKVNRVVYAFKGGNTQEFWCYNPSTENWIELEPIPLGPSKRRVKLGGSLCYHKSRVYALKGNNTTEFWVYSVPERMELESGTQRSQNATFRFPLSDFWLSSGIWYLNLSEPLDGSLRIYNITGRLLRTILFRRAKPKIISISDLPAGVYFLRIAVGSFTFNKKIVHQK